MEKRLKIILVAGARPNFMKIAPIFAEFKKYPRVDCMLVHTGQHYDKKMSQVFFDDLNIPKPDVNLKIGSGSHAEQTGKILIAFDKVLERSKPDLVIVVGDVNSTIACGLSAVKRGVKLAHVEAGLRSFDLSMPEEINRILTDRISDFLFCTEGSAVKNLKSEGVVSKKIFLVGNTMIDTLEKSKIKAQKSKVLDNLGLESKKYALVTLHRPSNVDDKNALKKLVAVFGKIAEKMPVVFPIHPRTRKNLELWRIKTGEIQLIEPLSYLDFLKLMSHSSVVLTDSGGIQEETTVLGIPCLTLRKNTERPITIEKGTNILTGADPQKILAAVSKIPKNPPRKKSVPPLWDGKAAKRIVKIIAESFDSRFGRT